MRLQPDSYHRCEPQVAQCRENNADDGHLDCDQSTHALSIARPGART